ncbi:phosphotransferase enzyme family protein, partial [candidate division CSSED10-310 bacterium]
MDNRIRQKFTAAILEEVLARIDIEQQKLNLLDGFESFVYEFSREERDYILKISHSSRRTADMIHGEIDWLQYLAAFDVPVAKPALSARGNYIEIIGDNTEYFTAISFEKVPGTFVSQEQWTPALFLKMGQIMGRMHHLTKSYKPARSNYKRPEWYEETAGFAEKYLPESENLVKEKYADLCTFLMSLPKDKDSYGLIYYDFHSGNFYVDQDRIFLFDFDDCQYSWFADDIAIALFYAVPHHCDTPQALNRAREFYDQFMAGYARENTIDPAWLSRIPHFLKLREIDLYICIHR